MTQADTIQLNADFVNIRSAYFWGASAALDGVGAVSVNTLITLNAAWAKDDGYLVVYGASVQQ